MKGQRGFSLVEVLVASAIAFLLGWVLLAIAHSTLLASAHLNARLRARSSIDRLCERLQSDAASSWSLFVPPTDVNGAPNVDGHELDFATEDASHRVYHWAYLYNAATERVTDYAVAAGVAPQPGDVFDGITAFAVQTHAISDLTNQASDAYDPLFAGAVVTPVSVPFDWDLAAFGGNGLVRLHATAAGLDRTLLLSSDTAPSHFTVVVRYTPPPPSPGP